MVPGFGRLAIDQLQVRDVITPVMLRGSKTAVGAAALP